MPTIAGETLKKALLFVRQARNTSPNDREALVANFEAAVVFCRSVTFHLQSQFAHSPGFLQWYETKHEHMRRDPLSRFMLEQRNYVLKVGPAAIRRVINVSVVESVSVTATISARVIRGQPWYRRSPRILFHDLISPLREFASQRRSRAAARIEARSAPPSGAEATHDLYFQQAEWAGSPALDLLEKQLHMLSAVVEEAAGKFDVQRTNDDA
jgi:hypothetical protein